MASVHFCPNPGQSESLFDRVKKKGKSRALKLDVDRNTVNGGWMSRDASRDPSTTFYDVDVSRGIIKHRGHLDLPASVQRAR